jgi:hypothetical protein
LRRVEPRGRRPASGVGRGDVCVGERDVPIQIDTRIGAADRTQAVLLATERGWM